MTEIPEPLTYLRDQCAATMTLRGKGNAKRWTPDPRALAELIAAEKAWTKQLQGAQ